MGAVLMGEGIDSGCSTDGRRDNCRSSYGKLYEVLICRRGSTERSMKYS